MRFWIKKHTRREVLNRLILHKTDSAKVKVHPEIVSDVPQRIDHSSFKLPPSAFLVALIPLIIIISLFNTESLLFIEPLRNVLPLNSPRSCESEDRNLSN